MTNRVSISPMKSTNVRLIAARAALRLAASVSAPIAARLLENAFLATRRHPTPERERLWLAPAERTRLESRGRSLTAWVWGSEGPTILLAHGWEGRGSQLGALVEPLRAFGFRVVTFDAPGHGHSPGRRSSLIEMAAAVSDAARRFGPLAGVVAHSAGAAATTIALHEGARASRLVYFAPPADLGAFLERVAGVLGLGQEVAAIARSRIEARFGFRWDEIVHARLATSMRSPLLVLHDSEDREIEIRNSRELVSAWPGSRIQVTEGLGHRRILRDPAVVARAVSFLSSEAPYAAVSGGGLDSEASTTRSFPSSLAR